MYSPPEVRGKQTEKAFSCISSIDIRDGPACGIASIGMCDGPACAESEALERLAAQVRRRRSLVYALLRAAFAASRAGSLGMVWWCNGALLRVPRLGPVEHH